MPGARCESRRDWAAGAVWPRARRLDGRASGIPASRRRTRNDHALGWRKDDRGNFAQVHRPLTRRGLLEVDQCFSRTRTTATEQCACRTTASETVPSRKRSRAPLPCEPRTIKSACQSFEISTITDLGVPFSTSVDTLIPWARNVSAVFSTSAKACLVSSFQTVSRPGSNPLISRFTRSDGGSTTCKTRTSVSFEWALAITACMAASENLESSTASRIFMHLTFPVVRGQDPSEQPSPHDSPQTLSRCYCGRLA